MPTLLFEIGTEEIPAGVIDPACRFLAKDLGRRLDELHLRHESVRSLGTPRRLTVVVDGLVDRQPDRVETHKGPPVKAAFDEQGRPTKVAEGFARARGVTVADLERVQTPKGEYVMVREEVPGQSAMTLLPGVLADLAAAIPFPKSMRWGEGEFAFIRPIQWIVALFDGRVVPLRIGGVDSSALTRGHRFHAPAPFEVSGAQDYTDRLAERMVLVDPAARRRAVIEAVTAAVAEQCGQDAEPVLEEGLVDTVTNLVEYPSPVAGRFERRFLELPQEVLVTSMREHQKYFPVRSRQDGRLLPYFVAVNNTRIQDQRLASSGHERVLRARLADALFFFHQDRQMRLADRYEALDGIVFQQRLGTMRQKSERMRRLAVFLAERVAPELADTVDRAARLAKCDLLTEMVGEFPSLQGVMGREYARHDGEEEAVAMAVYEHYLPLRAGGRLPSALPGALVGLADRLDTLAGCFGIGARPTGSTDPFGLRRAALAVLHLIEGFELPLSLQAAVQAAFDGYPAETGLAVEGKEQVLDFLRIRFENDQVAKGRDVELVRAATSAGFDDLLDCLARMAALERIRESDAFAALSGSFKRIRNIVKDHRDTAVDEALLEEEAERRLFETLVSLQRTLEPLVRGRRYDEALQALLVLEAPVARFFDDVLVMAEDERIRRNRLGLLAGLAALVRRIGDISRLH